MAYRPIEPKNIGDVRKAVYSNSVGNHGRLHKHYPLLICFGGPSIVNSNRRDNHKQIMPSVGAGEFSSIDICKKYRPELTKEYVNWIRISKVPSLVHHDKSSSVQQDANKFFNHQMADLQAMTGDTGLEVYIWFPSRDFQANRQMAETLRAAVRVLAFSNAVLIGT